MPPKGPWGPLRPDTERIVLSADARKNAAWRRFWPDVIAIFKDGDTLGEVESAWLADYLESAGRADLALGDVQTAQIPRNWARQVMGSDAAASSAIGGLVDMGVLTLVHKSDRCDKGHASLYVVNPLPEPNPPP